MGKAANSSIPLKDIHITDRFWNKYVHLVKDVIIPYQWDILNDRLEGVETSHCQYMREKNRGNFRELCFRIPMWRNGWKR